MFLRRFIREGTPLPLIGAKSGSGNMKQTTERTRPGLRQEAFAVFGIFISLFLFLSLVSYSYKVKGNWCGEIGILIAQALFGFTGWGGYLLPSLILLLSLLSFSPSMSCSRLPHVVSGLTGAIISFCGLLSSWTIKEPGDFSAGGFLGKTVFVVLDSVVGHGGTVLVLVLVLLFSLMLSVQFSLYQLFIISCRFLAKFGSLLLRTSGSANEKRILSEKTITERRLEMIDKAVPEPLVLQTTALPNMPELKEPVADSKKSVEDEEFAAKLIARGDWQLPPLTLLSKGSQLEHTIDKEAYYKTPKQLEQKLPA
jgi:DNA segregation ATPase FtsK/SpoIIIE, S-DNA-T family